VRGALALLASALVLATPAAASTLPQVGKHLYGQYCLACHGANAAGRTSPATIGSGPRRSQHEAPQPGIGPSLRGVGELAADFYLRTGYMPLSHVGLQPKRNPNNVLPESQIRALIAYIGTFGGPGIPRPHPERGNISEGQRLFTEHCAGCHQIVAQGGFVTGAEPPPLEDANDVQVAQAVRIGPYVMPTFTKKALSDRQLDSIIRYIDYTKHPDDPGGWPIGYLGPVPEGLVTWFIAAVALVCVCLGIGRRLTRP
jgi:ubiquinol-cytochrome c reductase cytochrome c subunit